MGRKNNLCSRHKVVVVSSYNVNGIRQNLKRKSLFYFLKQKNHDVILLQETHSCIIDEKLWKCEWRGKIIYAHGASNSKGVAVLIKKSLKCDVRLLKSNLEGRFLLTLFFIRTIL